jgi:hypothetical protein
VSAQEDARYPPRVHDVDQRIRINQHKVSDITLICA